MVQFSVGELDENGRFLIKLLSKDGIWNTGNNTAICLLLSPYAIRSENIQQKFSHLNRILITWNLGEFPTAEH